MTDKSVPKIENSFRELLAPMLREYGFKGSGKKFYRCIDGQAQVIEIQGHRSGEKFAINMGVHPLAIPLTIYEDPPALKQLREMDCLFRRRLSLDTADTWWSYCNTQTSMNLAVNQAMSVFIAVGKTQLDEIAKSNSDLYTVSALNFKNGDFSFEGFCNTSIRMAWALAFIRKSAGHKNDACDFASLALELIGTGKGARGLKPELLQFIKDI